MAYSSPHRRHLGRKLCRQAVQRAWKGLWIVFLFSLLVLMVRGTLQPMAQIRELQAENERLSRALQAAYEEQEHLLEERRLLLTQAGLILEARRLGLGKPGERRIIFQSEE